MASNKELTDQALALGAELGVEVKTDGLNNGGLASLVADLTAAKASKEAGPGAAAPGDGTPPAVPPGPPPPPVVDGAATGEMGGPPPPAPAPAPPPPPKGSVVVAAGQSIVCRRGHLDEGAIVQARDFADGKEGEDQLADLLKRGALVKS